MALPKLDVPRYETKLPSTGKKLIYRPYLVKEEKILMMAMESNDQNQMVRAIKDIIMACIDDVIDVENITMFDLEYLFTQLRAKSVGEVAKINVSCQNCEEKNEVNIDLTKVKVDVYNEKERRVKLTNNVSVLLKYPSVNEISNIQAEDKRAVDVLFDLVLSSIEAIYSGDEIFDAKDQTKQELSEFIESLNAEQFSSISKFIQNSPTVKATAVFDCTNCETHNEVELKGLANFFS